MKKHRYRVSARTTATPGMPALIRLHSPAYITYRASAGQPASYSLTLIHDEKNIRRP